MLFGKLAGRKGRCYLVAPVRSVGVVLASVVAGCAVARAGLAPVPAAPTAARPESLRVTVVYPAPTDVLQSHDSAFLFGAVRGGRGPVALGVNGQAVPVQPDGGWIAWVPLPDDSVAPCLLAATAGPDSSRTIFTARIAPRFHPPPSRAAWIDTTSYAPVGSLALPAGEGILLSVQAAPGASVHLVLPWGSSVPLVPDTLPAEPAWGVRAFDADTAAYRLPPGVGRYTGWLPAGAVRRRPHGLRRARRGGWGRHRHRALAADDHDGRHDVPAGRGPERRHGSYRDDRQRDPRAGRAPWHLQLVLPDRDGGGRVRPLERSGATAAVARRRRMGERDRRRGARAGDATASRSGGLRAPRVRTEVGDPAGAAADARPIPGHRAGSERDLAPVRRRVRHQLDAVRRHRPVGHTSALRAAGRR